jgi:LPS-assembly protein
MDVTADYTEMFDKEITSFFGNVEIIRADQKVSSDRASFDAVSGTMDAQGQVYYTENEVSLFSETALLNLNTNEARLRSALFIYPASALRGSAEVVYRDNKFLSRYKNTAITGCRPSNRDWVLHTDRLKINKRSGKASAKHAWLEFKGLPVLYSPYVSFPIDDRRVSGILTPSIGSSSESGVDVTVPYYWNISPNYDLTISPRYMSKRGGMIGGEFRYLTESSKGNLNLEYLPYDILRKEARYAGTFRNYTTFTPHLTADIDLNYVSDSAYFDELENALGISNSRYLLSQANLNYVDKGITFRTHLESYQSIDDEVIGSSKPHQKLPQITLNLDHSFDALPVDIAMDSEYVNFYRDDYQINNLSLAPALDPSSGRVITTRFNQANGLITPTDPTIPFAVDPITGRVINYHTGQLTGQNIDNSAITPIVTSFSDRVSGHRFTVKPSIAVPMKTAGTFLKPKFSLHHTSYFLDDRLFQKPETIHRTLPIFSVDGGLIFERDFNFSNSSYTHTLEPRLFYLYIPKEDQDDIPIFDSSFYDFSYSSLFRENSFSGGDRIQDANQITVAMTSRLINSKTGKQRLKLSVGEIFYFRDREVTLTGVAETRSYSNLIAELNASLTDELTFSGGIHWDPDENHIARGNVQLSYRDKANRIINLGYRYRGKDSLSPVTSINRADISFRWPLIDNWHGIGRWQYSLRYNSTTESFLGLEKASCCWRFRIIWRRFANTLTDPAANEMDEGIFVQMELKGLTSFGSKVDEFLERNLRGYQRIPE